MYNVTALILEQTARARVRLVDFFMHAEKLSYVRLLLSERNLPIESIHRWTNQRDWNMISPV